MRNEESPVLLAAASPGDYGESVPSEGKPTWPPRGVS